MIKLQEGQFVKITGAKVKNENDIFVVDCDYTKPDERYTVVNNEYCLNKVKLDGEKKEKGYTIVFYNEYFIKSNPDLQIEIVTDLKKAKKEVNEYLKNLNNNEMVVDYIKAENQEVTKGSIIRFTKGLVFGTWGNKFIGKDTIWVASFNGSQGLWIQKLGKKGQVLSMSDDKNSYSFTKKLTDTVIADYIEVVEKVETRKGDLVKEIKKEEVKPVKIIEEAIETVEETQQIKVENKNIEEPKPENNNNEKEHNEMEMLNNQFMNIFEDIKIENNTRLSKEDSLAMEEMKERYEAFKKTFYKYQEFYKNNTLVAFNNENYSSFNTKKMTAWLNENSMKECSSYISEIYRYFKNKYNVDLKNNFEKSTNYSAYGDIDVKGEENLKFYLNIDYNTIIDDIFEQLGGFDFEEKAELEIKEKMKEKCNRTDSKLKGKTVSIDTWLTWGHGWNGKPQTNSYTADETTKPIFKAVSHFESNEPEILNCFSDYVSHYRLEGSEFLELRKFDNLEKIEGVKFFKNGRIDLKFTNAQYALTFAREYCGLQV